MNDSSYCRLCAQLRANSDLITVIQDEVTNNLNLNYKIYHCFQIQIEINDKLPKSICSKCCDLVLSTYESIEKVQKAQDFLNNLFVQVENKDIKVEWLSKSDPVSDDLRNLIKTEQCKDNDSNFSDYKDDGDNSLDSDDLPLIKRLRFKTSEKELDKERNVYCNNLTEQIDKQSNVVNTLENYKWRCNLCSNVFDFVNLLQEHYEKEHNNKSPRYVCNDCDKAYVKYNVFKRHIQSHCTTKNKQSKFECETCGKLSHSKTLHDRHLAKHKDNDSENILSHECDYCHKKFTSAGYLAEHKENHIEWKNYIWRCTICSEEFHVKKELIQHFKYKHNKTAEFSCMDCSKIYTKYILFKRHVRTHKNCCQFRCDTCGKLFHDKRILRKHMKYVHEHTEVSKYICSICGKVFKWQTSFTYHKLHFHLPDDVKLQYECDICHKKVATEKSLAAHKEIHDGRFKKNHTCELCGLAFRQKGTLTAHIRHTHTNSKDNHRQCPLCFKILKHETQLRRHTRIVHSTEKRFECETCGKKFYLRSKYTAHMRLHTGELPYGCQYCQKRFRLKESLETHIRQHTGEKPYSCIDCNHDFTDFANYVKHMKRKHGVTSFKNVKKYSEVNSLFKQSISVLQNVLTS